MNIEKISEQYWLSEGPIKSFFLDIENNAAELLMAAKRIITGKESVPCTLKLTFHNLIKVSLFDQFPTDGYYTDAKISQIHNKEVEFCFTVHDSASQIYQEYNWVIKSKNFSWEEI